MPELRDLVRNALDRTIENGYQGWLSQESTLNIAVDLADSDADVEAHLTHHGGDDPQFLEKNVVPLVDEWLIEQKLRSA